MSVANLAYRDPSELPAGLPPELRKAQEAMFLPEIRQILKKLAEYNLGVCMPHKHNEETGRFETLPEEVVQVERALTVTFEPVTALKDRASYVPVAWMCQGDDVTGVTACKSVCFTRPGDSNHYNRHDP